MALPAVLALSVCPLELPNLLWLLCGHLYIVAPTGQSIAVVEQQDKSLQGVLALRASLQASPVQQGLVLLVAAAERNLGMMMMLLGKWQQELRQRIAVARDSSIVPVAVVEQQQEKHTRKQGAQQ
mmetsp:Transcript_5399/g.7191  ORF Transcript_5399/g.7191 Transcript_5399/m.7191 type:complete len:125 (+) Transcript_5399:415-789(+)